MESETWNVFHFVHYVQIFVKSGILFGNEQIICDVISVSVCIFFGWLVKCLLLSDQDLVFFLFPIFL